MKKLKKIVFGLIFGVVIAVVIVILSLDGIVKAGIEKGGSIAMGVGTEVESVSMGIFGGDFAIDKLKINNPKGFEGRKFLQLGHLGCQISMRTLMGDKVEVDEISLKGVEVSLMKRDGQFNYKVIMDHLAELGGGEVKEAEVKEADGGGKLFVIKKTVIEDIVFHIDLDLLGGVGATTFKLPKLELPAIGSDSSPADFGVVLGAVVKGLIQGAVDNGGELPAELLKDLKGTLADFDKVAGQVKDKAVEKVEELKGKATETLDKGIKDIGKKGGEAVDGLLKGFGK